VHESERLWCGTAPTSLSPSELQELKEKHSGFAKAAVEQEGEDLAYFEVFTAMAFKHFQEQQVAYCTSHRSLSLTSSRGVREPTAPCSVGCTDKRPGRKESNSPIFSSCFHRLIGFAFFFFYVRKVDIAVVEAGLGGATDATNVFPASGQLMSIVTSVGASWN
jgi:folylpolyglutamate synthase/dihydropteroate synthase